ncbi:MAG: L-seryl-tRNA(Sec) selenium transferase [Chloroflexi bacterium]|nr:L-seryl-tRNA(Sec) selenium transferase [Ardenticatenaceae bacterium]MBL1127033.1 L-seryl-tRNA(Sec) selenium transferase [Chloroflexota bacterium]NOG33094.1 L-seryl-tRNA(Sec) selenium transferase [Chloroflexota bacterium]GIK54609.1 MAG: L-seryl-tRNA(Sec) selenium transferase [Chloroflexota bacterium]
MRLRKLPGVDRLLQMPETAVLLTTYGRTLTVEALRHTLEDTRTGLLQGQVTATSAALNASVPGPTRLVQAAADWLENLLTPSLRPVINATGVIVHTNLGRAPLSQAARQAIDAAARGYSNLEYDLAAGKRGSRHAHATQLLPRLTGAESSMVVNNNAAAVLLMLTALCHGRQVIISRGQLVEIGGGFRIPDVLAQSGATLVEVGTTNRTHLRDYARAINEQTAAILVTHHSNYKIVGFTNEPSLAELAELAHTRQLPLLFDQGSGALLDTSPFGLDPEPTVPGGIQAGCDLVAFSGDKLLGGPQAGILVGRADLIARCQQHPLARAVRADKLCLAGLSATLTHYVQEEALTAVPVWRMISMSVIEVTAVAQEWLAHLDAHGIAAELVDGESTVGGGSLPGTSLPTRLVSLATTNPDALAARLRAEAIPVIGRIQDGRYLLDPRTVLPEQVDDLWQSLVNCARTEN